ncbi:MAG: hypothetical protein WBG92_17505 [Thiohalocapsa sp.]
MIAPRHFRILVLLLTIGYFVEVAATANYSSFGAQFRFLTIWALTGNLIAAAAMLRSGYGRPDGRFDIALSVLAIINVLVVFSYWRLFFIDPALVNGDNTPKPYREYYLHLVGPILMWIDLFWLKRGFRRLLPVLIWLAVVVLTYVAWAELLVGPLNAKPVGDVTSGLPYPFLNDLEPQARATFYGTIYGTGAVFTLIFYGFLALLQRRSRGGQRELETL